MHTSSPVPLAFRFFFMTPLVPDRPLAVLRILLVALPSVFLVSSAVGQVGFPGTPDDAGLNVRLYPADFYSPRVGPGVGIGLVAHNVARSNDQWLLTAAPALGEQVGSIAFASANPRRAQQYVMADVRGLHTDRDWLFGRSPNRSVLERTSWHGRVRLGRMILGDRILVQPHAVVSTHAIDTVRPSANDDAPTSTSLPTPGSRQTGLRPGVSLEFDTRDHVLQSTRGLLLQATWQYYMSLDSTPLRFSQIEADAYTYLPLGGLHRFVFRVSSLLTQARGEHSIPVYMRPRLGAAVLPGLSRSQFRGHDRLVGSTLYRFPITNFYGLATLEGHIGIHFAGIYDDVGEELGRTISFSADDRSENGVQPFRPAASAGLRALIPARNRASLELAIGLSPYGISGVRFTFTRSLQALRPPHHVLDHLW